MTVYLRAHRVTLELPLDMQRIEQGDTLGGIKATIGGHSRLYQNVLKDITFEANEGDRIGILGLNGAGKTTLLRVLNGAFPPTHGRLERSGSVQSLLNASLGFSQYASLIENVFLRGTAMGLRKRQLEAAVPSILDFAGLTEKATHRLNTLSSGQRMRLGFAISTAIQPDILLMDEWIATGDAAFLKRAQERLTDRFNESRIVVLANHSTGLLKQMCNKAIVLHEGSMRYFGAITEGIEAYRDIVSRQDASTRKTLLQTDPLLFGQALGMVEKITVGPDCVEIEGWATDSRGREVHGLSIEILDQKVPLDRFERIDRDDVRRYLGKKGSFGFRGTVSTAQALEMNAVRDWLAINIEAPSGLVGEPIAIGPRAVIEAA